MGVNLGEAVNFAAPDWLRFGAAALGRLRHFRKPCVVRQGVEEHWASGRTSEGSGTAMFSTISCFDAAGMDLTTSTLH